MSKITQTLTEYGCVRVENTAGKTNASVNGRRVWVSGWMPGMERVWEIGDRAYFHLTKEES